MEQYTNNLEKINVISKTLNNFINNILRENNICINSVGNLNNDYMDTNCKDIFINNIDVMIKLKQKLIKYVNNIDLKIKTYDNSINTIKRINYNNKYVKDIDIIDKYTKLNIQNNKNINKNYTNYKVAKNVYCKFEEISDLSELDPCIKYLNKNNNNKNITKGLYLCLYKNVYIKLKLGLFSNNKQQYKIFLCPNKFKNMCKIEKCSNIHYGDKIKKIEYNNKTINKRFFGNPYSLAKDLNMINIDSIKILTAYLSTEILSLYCWYDKFKKNDDLVKIIISDPLILQKD
jgi:hypothetical protein